MSKPNARFPETLRSSVELSWHRFLDVYEPLRPELYRYCRHLTRSPWDADDLVQDALFRAFVKLGCLNEAPANPRAWLFRIASNLWLDRVRARRPEGDAPGVRGAPDAQALREAAGTLLSQLSPQERAAVVLKEAFDFTLEEIAEALSTTTGTVKSALHRGRGKLTDPEPEAADVPRPPVLDAFVAAFNAGDLTRVTGLLLETVEVEVVRGHTDYGVEAAAKGALHGMLFGTQLLEDPARAEARGLEVERFTGVLPRSPRVEARLHRGEWILVHWYAHTDGEAVRAITRVEVAGGRIARAWNYFFTPDVLAELCGELGVPFRSNGYRFWHPAGEEA